MTPLHSVTAVLQSLNQASSLHARRDGVLALSGRPGAATLAATTTTTATTTSSSGDPTLADVIAQLKAAADGPDAEVSRGNPPMPQNVGILPAYDREHALESYGHLVEMSSLAALYTALWSAAVRAKRGHPDPYRISVAKEAAQAFADMADCSYQIMSEPLAGFYNFAQGTSHVFNEKISKAELHLEFLSELFKGFSLSKSHLLQLDGVLTKFMESLKTVTLTTESSESTVDYTLRVNQVMRLNISGDEQDPVWAFQPRTRLIFMHIDASSYKWASNKASQQDYQFHMQYVVADFDLNVNKFLASRKKLDAIFQSLSGMTMRAFGEKINAAPVQEEPST
jgi:hypothetical protein